MKKSVHFSRSEIDLDSLRKLKDLFGKDGELDQDAFVEAFGEILGDNLTELQLTHLFMKIDANSDGSVDWDEFLNYMFLENQDIADDGDGDGKQEDDPTAQFFPASYDIFEINNGIKKFHKDQLSSLIYIEKTNQLLSASQDGMVRFWHPTTLVHQSGFHTGQLQPNAAMSVRGTLNYERNWITDMSYMSCSNKLAVSSIDTGVSFYDLQTENRKLVARIPMERFRHAAPLCLGYFHDTAGHQELLQIGDDGGAVYVYPLQERHWNFDNDGHVKSNNLDELNAQTGTEDAEERVTVSGEDIDESDDLASSHFKSSVLGTGNRERANNTSQALSSSSRIVFRRHTDHVTQVQYIHGLSSLVTASLDSTLNVFDLERARLKRSFTQHKKAVYSFTWCAGSKVIASSGLERQIVLWSPYSRRSVASLYGHTSSVIKVDVNEDNNQLISLSADNTIKIWDIRNHKCIQTIAFANAQSGGGGGGGGSRGEGVNQPQVTCLTYMRKHKSLVAASNKLKIFPIRPPTETSLRSHNRPVISALYNSNFHQVVSVDEQSNLRIWNLESGEAISRFQLRTKKAVDTIDQDSSRFAAAAAENSTLTAAAAGLNVNTDEQGNQAPVDALEAAKEISLSLQEGDDASPFAMDTGNDGVTALCFDDGGRRVITGSHDGKNLKIWNFSNGCLLKTLLKVPEGSEGEVDGFDQEVLISQHHGTSSHAHQHHHVGGRSGHAGSGTGNGTATGSNVGTENPMPSVSLTAAATTEDEEQRSNNRKVAATHAEVTRIVYVVNVLPRIPGHPTIRNKYIVSVGWDRRIYVWMDGAGANDGNEQGYCIRMPDEDDQLEKGHQDDITTVVFLPPDTVATGSHDGQIIFWCLSSGRITRHFREPGAVSIEAMEYLERRQLLIAAEGNGGMLVLNVATSKLSELDLFAHLRIDRSKASLTDIAPVVSLCKDASNDLLIAGDENGRVHVWEVMNPGTSDDDVDVFLPCSLWQAHQQGIRTLDFVGNSRLAEGFVLTGCAEGYVKMWTLTGQIIGQFGQLDPWSMDISYSQEENELRAKRSGNMLQVSDSLTNRPWLVPMVKQHKFNAVASLQEKSTFRMVPGPGEVWVKLDVDMIKSVEVCRNFTDESGQFSQIHPKVVQGLITIIRHDEITNEIKGWDGLSTEGMTEKAIPMADFLKCNETGAWIREEDFTERIGRIYCDEDQSQINPYKVLFIRCKRIERVWVVVDTKGLEHRIGYETETVGGLRPPRSISLYYRRLAMINHLRTHKPAKPLGGEKHLDENAEAAPLAAQTSERVRKASLASTSSTGLQQKNSIVSFNSGAGREEPPDEAREQRSTYDGGFSKFSQGLASYEQRSSGPNSWKKTSFMPRAPSAASSGGAFSRGQSPRQYRRKLRRNVAEQDPTRLTLDMRQRVHEIADIPVDFGQLRATLSIAGAIERGQKSILDNPKR